MTTTTETGSRPRGRPAGVPTIALNVRCPEDLVEALDRWAGAKGIPRMDALRTILKDRLDGDAGLDPALAAPPPTQRDFLHVASPSRPSLLNGLTQRSERNVVLTAIACALFACGVRGLVNIAEGLNASGIAAPLGGRWHAKTVSRLLDEIGFSADGVPLPDHEGPEET